ncbi:MAG: hypothetical protein GX979_08950 [Firmicutes bacterium]|nr:hypothetical protein [Bacillota bacterium]
MKAVATPWSGLAKFLLLGFGIPFSLVGLLLFFAFDGNWALLLNGLLWLVIGGAFLIKEVSHRRRLHRLKQEGLFYEGTVVNIIPSHWIRIGSYITARVEFVYKTEKGDCTKRSGYVLLSPFDRMEDLQVNIYVDRYHSEKYMVELLRRGVGR